MVKGDKRKAQILEKARDLYMQKGISDLSLKEVLDALDISKGCFYHYFVSKTDVFAQAMAQMAEGYAVNGRDEAEKCATAIEKLNTVFDKSGVFSSCAPFVQLLTRSIRYDDMWLKAYMEDAMLRAFSDDISRILALGVQDQEFYTAYPLELADMIVRLLFDMLETLSRYLLSCDMEPNLGFIMSKIVFVRSIVEKQLEAPFGSITLISAAELCRACQKVWNDEIIKIVDSEEQ